MYDVIIIGGGPAGLTAAVYTRRAGMKTLIIEAAVCGGQIINSLEVDNFPSREHIPGWQLADEWQKQAMNLGTEIIYGDVTGIDVNGKIKTVHSAKGDFEAKTVIIANGAGHRRIDCPGAMDYTGRGVSTCATCDGAFFRGKEVAVVGGGNTAFEDALYLSSLCTKVWLINRRAQFRANPTNVEAVKEKENIEILVPYVPYEVIGSERVTGFKVQNTETGEVRELSTPGIFTAIGMVPNNERFSNVAKLDEGGYIVTDENCSTGSFGIFAVGDTRSKNLRQLVTAASDGAIAANQAASIVNTWKD
jgi:thioredoxin reductase (NADPH)